MDEVYFGYLLVEDLLVVAFEEVASGVFEDVGLYYYWAFYVCFDYLHDKNLFRAASGTADGKLRAAKPSVLSLNRKPSRWERW